jgi:hypothetical protein
MDSDRKRNFRDMGEEVKKRYAGMICAGSIMVLMIASGCQDAGEVPRAEDTGGTEIEQDAGVDTADTFQDVGDEPEADGEQIGWAVEAGEAVAVTPGRSSTIEFDVTTSGEVGDIEVKIGTPPGVSSSPEGLTLATGQREFQVVLKAGLDAAEPGSTQLVVETSAEDRQKSEEIPLTVLEPRAGARDVTYNERGSVFAECLADNAQIMDTATRDGMYFVAYSCIDGPEIDSYIMKVDGSGLVEQWGRGGVARVTDVQAVTPIVLKRISVDARGRVYGVTTSLAGGEQQDAVIRLKSDGAYDPAFGDGGIAYTAQTSGVSQFKPNGVAATSGGGAVISGYGRFEVEDAGVEGPGLLRVNSVGEADITFGDMGDGYYVGPRADAATEQYTGTAPVVALPGGDLVSGYRIGDSLDLVRFTAQGTRDVWTEGSEETDRLLTPSSVSTVWSGFNEVGFAVGTAQGLRLFGADGTVSMDLRIDAVAESVVLSGENEFGEGEEIYVAGRTKFDGEDAFVRISREGNIVELQHEWRPEFEWAGAWEWSGNPMVIASDERFLWLAGVKQRARGDGSVDNRVVSWRIWRY